jgi:hypothetical protein
MDGIIHIITEAITTDIATMGSTTSISIAGTTIGTGVGLSASVGVQDTIAIGKPIDARSALAILSNRPCAIRPNVLGEFRREAIRLLQLGLT